MSSREHVALTAEQQRELDFVLATTEDGPMDWHFFSDKGERHTTHTIHDFFRFAHTHRGWGYTNMRPREMDDEMSPSRDCGPIGHKTPLKNQ